MITTGEIVRRTRFSVRLAKWQRRVAHSVQDLLTVSCDGSDAAFVAAFDKRTCAVRWKTPRHQPAGASDLLHTARDLHGRSRWSPRTRANGLRHACFRARDPS